MAKSGPKPGPKPLNSQQRAFLDAYVAHGNATEAYRAAYPNAKDPATGASKLLKKPRIKAELERVREVVETRTALSRGAVVDRLWAIGCSDERDRVPAITQLCKIMGYNAPEEVSVTLTGAAERIRARVSKMLDRVDHADGEAQPDA